jgi:hypothetical protein
MSGEPGRLGTTPLRLLLALAGIGLVLGWSIVPVLARVRGTVPSVPWSTVLVLAGMALILLVAAWLTYRTIHRRHERVDPRRAVNLLVLAKASAMTGALLLGGYVGFGAHFVASMDIPLPQQRVIHSAIAAFCAALLCVGGLLLERACRVPRGPDDADEVADV